MDYKELLLTQYCVVRRFFHMLMKRDDLGVFILYMEILLAACIISIPAKLRQGLGGGLRKLMILVTSDFHLNDNPRDAYRHDYMQTITREIKRNKVSHLLVLGDLTDAKGGHGAWLVDKIFGYVYDWSKLCDVVFITGNHDYLSSSTPFFGALNYLENVSWIKEPWEGDLDGILWLPHTNDYEEDWSGLNVRSYNLVFTHNTFAGALAEHGKELGGIPRTVFSRKQKVISGDVHVPQKLGPIEYVGSPYPINFGDSPAKHLMLLDDRLKISYIPYDGPNRVMIDLPSMDRDAEVSGLKRGDMVKVRVRVSGGQLGNFQKFKERIVEELVEIGCVVNLVQPLVDPGDSVQLGGEKVHKRTDQEILDSYSYAVGVKDPVRKTGVRLMRKVV